MFLIPFDLCEVMPFMELLLLMLLFLELKLVPGEDGFFLLIFIKEIGRKDLSL